MNVFARAALLMMAFALAACSHDPMQAMTLANTIARAADSLPALVGALTGAYYGALSLLGRNSQALEEEPPLDRPVLAEPAKAT